MHQHHEVKVLFGPRQEGTKIPWQLRRREAGWEGSWWENLRLEEHESHQASVLGRVGTVRRSPIPCLESTSSKCGEREEKVMVLTRGDLRRCPQGLTAR